MTTQRLVPADRSDILRPHLRGTDEVNFGGNILHLGPNLGLHGIWALQQRDVDNSIKKTLLMLGAVFYLLEPQAGTTDAPFMDSRYTPNDGQAGNDDATNWVNAWKARIAATATDHPEATELERQAPFPNARFTVSLLNRNNQPHPAYTNPPTVHVDHIVPWATAPALFRNNTAFHIGLGNSGAGVKTVHARASRIGSTSVRWDTFASIALSQLQTGLPDAQMATEHGGETWSYGDQKVLNFMGNSSSFWLGMHPIEIERMHDDQAVQLWSWFYPIVTMLEADSDPANLNSIGGANFDYASN